MHSPPEEDQTFPEPFDALYNGDKARVTAFAGGVLTVVVLDTGCSRHTKMTEMT